MLIELCSSKRRPARGSHSSAQYTPGSLAKTCHTEAALLITEWAVDSNANGTVEDLRTGKCCETQLMHVLNRLPASCNALYELG